MAKTDEELAGLHRLHEGRDADVTDADALHRGGDTLVEDSQVADASATATREHRAVEDGREAGGNGGTGGVSTAETVIYEDEPRRPGRLAALIAAGTLVAALAGAAIADKLGGKKDQTVATKTAPPAGSSPTATEAAEDSEVPAASGENSVVLAKGLEIQKPVGDDMQAVLDIHAANLEKLMNYINFKDATEQERIIYQFLNHYLLNPDTNDLTAKYFGAIRDAQNYRSGDFFSKVDWEIDINGEVDISNPPKIVIPVLVSDGIHPGHMSKRVTLVPQPDKTGQTVLLVASESVN
jgi:hypothetical protein